MKKILVLAMALAMVAVLAVPLAAGATLVVGTGIMGTITAPTITVTTPSAISFVPFMFGVNKAKSGTAGSVSITYNSATTVSWQVVAQDNSDSAWGYMKIGGNGAALTNPLYIGPDGINWCQAWVAGGPFLTYTGTDGTGTPFDFWAYQQVVAGDAVGSYSTLITFTATITSYA
jgi:hypothetical protein